MSTTIGRDHVVNLVTGNPHPFAVHFDLVVVAHHAALGRATIHQVAARALAVISFERRVEALMPFIVACRSLRWNVHPQKHEQKDEDRIDNDPHDIRGPTTLPLLYSPLAHDGSLSLGPENVSPARSACNRAHGRSLGKT